MHSDWQSSEVCNERDFHQRTRALIEKIASEFRRILNGQTYSRKLVKTRVARSYQRVVFVLNFIVFDLPYITFSTQIKKN